VPCSSDGQGQIRGSPPCPRTDTPLGLPRRHGRGKRAAAGSAGAAARQEPHQDPVLPGGLRHWRIVLLLDAALLQPSSKQHRRPRRFILLFVVGVFLAGFLLPQVIRFLLASAAASPAHLHPEVCILPSPYLFPIPATPASTVMSSVSWRRPPQASSSAPVAQTQSKNAILVSHRQRGNPLLKHIRNARWAFADVVPDYVLGQSSCALYLSIRYHLLHPDYLYYRIRELQKNFRLRVILCHIDVEDVVKPLHEITRTALLHDCTLLCGWRYYSITS
jgi:DNA repair protein Rad10